MAHGVFRSDLMLGTTAGEELVSCKYFANDVAADIDNGCVVKVEALIPGERELYKAVNCAANTNIDDVVIIGSPEMFYDERKHNLDEFYNEAGKAARGYRLHRGNIFSVTADVLSAAAAIAVGDIVELQAGNKMKVVKNATSGSTVVGKILEIETTRLYTYYAIKIA